MQGNPSSHTGVKITRRDMNGKLRQALKGKNLANLVVIGIIGLLLLVLSNTLFDNNSIPNDNSNNQLHMPSQVSNITQSHQRKLEIRLEEALSNVAGVGEVIVMVTLSQGTTRVIAEDISSTEAITTETDAQGGTREVTNRTYNSTHVISGGVPLILLETEPQVEGVIIVAQGGEDVRIVESLTNAARAVLGIEAHRVSVLPMR